MNTSFFLFWALCQFKQHNLSFGMVTTLGRMTACLADGVTSEHVSQSFRLFRYGSRAELMFRWLDASHTLPAAVKAAPWSQPPMICTYIGHRRGRNFYITTQGTAHLFPPDLIDQQ